MAALVTANLDYGAYYLTMPLGEAFDKSRRLLTEPNGDFPKSDLLLKKINGDITRPRYNVVLFLEESLAGISGVRLAEKARPSHHISTSSPPRDCWKTFTPRVIARCAVLKAYLSSFPPCRAIPSFAVTDSKNEETIARVLEARWLWQGFHPMADAVSSTTCAPLPWPMATTASSSKKIFRTRLSPPLGVCATCHPANKTLTELRDLNTKGIPFLATVLSVSNHKPYTYPPGRIPEDPNRKTRENAVKYTDWALGQFFASAKKEAFWTNTIFTGV